jgi:hypothetical protein
VQLGRYRRSQGPSLLARRNWPCKIVSDSANGTDGRDIARQCRAPRSGRGVAGFKSCHSDQYLAEFQILTGTDCGTVSRVLLAFSAPRREFRRRTLRVLEAPVAQIEHQTTKRGIVASQGCTTVRSGTRKCVVVRRRMGGPAALADALGWTRLNSSAPGWSTETATAM